MATQRGRWPDETIAKHPTLALENIRDLLVQPFPEATERDDLGEAERALRREVVTLTIRGRTVREIGQAVGVPYTRVWRAQKDVAKIIFVPPARWSDELVTRIFDELGAAGVRP